VLADECGVCVVPSKRAAEVLAIAQRWTAWEDERLKRLAAGISLDEFTRLKRPE
jgi:regulator of RNase E activity RraA